MIIIAICINVIITPSYSASLIPIKVLVAVKLVLTFIVITATILLIKVEINKKEKIYNVIIYISFIFSSASILYDLYKHIKLLR